VVPPEHAARVGIGRRLKGDAIEPMPTAWGLPQARPARSLIAATSRR